MKLYSNLLTTEDVFWAFADARRMDGQDIRHQDVRAFVPRGYRNGVEFYAYSVTGKRASAHRPQGGQFYGPDAARAATWDAWGYVIARLFDRDPEARIGYYDGRNDFIVKVNQELDRWHPPGTGAFLDLKVRIS
jgi:hypothetical protein